jgi:carbamate kinase
MKPLILIALGGNALIQKGQKGTAEEQFANLRMPMRQIARLSRNYRIVLTHGNGPQAGNLLLQQESCREVPNMPLEIIVAMTQGQIGYMIESSLDRALMEIGVTTEQLFVSLISYVVVDENDPAFQNPTKPIGPFYTEEQARGLPYTMVKTDKGFRRVVASPKPLAIVEHREIKKLIEMGFIVICCGGGGIPVIRKERKFRGVDAVIDKDLASAVLAGEIKADAFVIASDVPGVSINWLKPQQQQLRNVQLAELERYMAEGHFPAGSMGPKVQAILQFHRATGDRGIICHLEDIERAIAGEAGTEVM